MTDSRQQGFSLIELLVVVAIIGILAAVGVVAYQGYTKSAKVAATKSNHRTMVKWAVATLGKCEIGKDPLGVSLACWGCPPRKRILITSPAI